MRLLKILTEKKWRNQRVFNEKLMISIHSWYFNEHSLIFPFQQVSSSSCWLLLKKYLGRVIECQFTERTICSPGEIREGGQNLNRKFPWKTHPQPKWLLLLKKPGNSYKVLENYGRLFMDDISVFFSKEEENSSNLRKCNLSKKDVWYPLLRTSF